MFIQALSSTNPRIPSVSSVTSVRCFLHAVSRMEANVFIQALSSTNPRIPSVASVNSVRCFPHSRISRTEAKRKNGKEQITSEEVVSSR